MSFLSGSADRRFTRELNEGKKKRKKNQSRRFYLPRGGMNGKTLGKNLSGKHATK